MTFNEALRQPPARRPALARARAVGLFLALVVALPAWAQAPAAPVVVSGQPVAAQRVSVSKIDFKRGDDGAGRLILQFDGSGAAPDLRNQGREVVIDVDNASLPVQWRKPIDVADFATPVQRIDARAAGSGTRLVLRTNADFDSLAYQSGNEYVVEVTPRRGVPAAGAVTATSVQKAAAKVATRGYTGKPVTFNFQDVPVRTVLQLIAEESNLNIVASDSVQGNVTLRLINVPWDQALDIVLRAKGLDKRRDGSVVWVAPQPELAKYEQDKEDARIALDNRVDTITDYIQVNYHSATAIYKALTEAKGVGGSGGGGNGSNQNDNGFLSPRGRIVADERTNTLMISDIPKKVAQMRELISHIDRPVDQVLIEGRIVIATDTFARDLGAKFGIGGTHTYGDNVATVGSSATGGGTAATRGLNVELPTPIYTSGTAASLAYTLLGNNFNLDLELQALQEEGRGEVISNPRVVTSNQREAHIKQGKEIGYVTITGGTSGTAATPNVQFKEVMLELDVTPTITNDDRVFLNMKVNKDEVDSYMTVSNFGTIPIINRREVNTAVLVDDGQTVVIGGVYEFTDRESVSKVPFLGDIPFLGNLFKSRGKSKDKAELLVFVTPKIMRVAKRPNADVVN